MIAIIVPTIREEKFKEFYSAWIPLFEKHNVKLYKVTDGESPNVNGLSVKEVMGKYSDLIYNKNDGVRNLGFAQAYKDGADILITLDDDTLPVGDTIQDHLDILNTKQPTSWINTVDDIYMRGFPYWAREESVVMFSHGVWNGVYDFDASTQLVLGIKTPQHRKMPIPKGVLMPVCVMNVAFRREVMPYYYQAPMGIKVLKETGLYMDRFADIMSGVEVKKHIDANNWAMVTGYAKVNHNRASNPFTNLVKESYAIGVFENYETSDFRKFYLDKMKLWQKFLNENDNKVKSI